MKKHQLAAWFIKAKDDFPAWKRFIWRLLGVKRVGCDSGYKITMHYFNGIYLVTKIEVEND